MSTGTVRIAFFIILLQHQGLADLLEDDCGSTVAVGLRIVGGQNPFFNAYPWMALIRNPKGFICGGTLINSRFVLTAAHCIVNQTRLIVRLGEYDQSTDVDCRGSYCLPPYEEYYVEKAHLYSQFNATSHGEDIGLLRLERQVAFKVHIQPICIILDAQRKAETDLIPEYMASGWGKTENNTMSKVLKEVAIQRSDPQWCWNQFWKQLESSQICGTSNAGDTCDGDSGSPLGRLIRFGNVWRFVQFGIVSYGASKCFGIGVYTDVMSYVDWIRKTVLERDIEVVLPRMDLLDGGCFSNSTSSSSTPYSWLARIYVGTFRLAYGTLISDRFVLTTAVFTKNDPPLLVVLAKSIYKVQSTYIHTSHTNSSAEPAYDISLLKLTRKVLYTDNLRPICLPSTEYELKIFQEKQGKQETFIILADDSLKKTVAQSHHRRWFPRWSDVEKGNRGMGMEIGSGSPLVWLLKHGNRQAYAIGRMASGRVGGEYFYTDVLFHMSWIWDIIKPK